MFTKNRKQSRSCRTSRRLNRRFEHLEPRTVLSAAGWTVSLGGGAGADLVQDAAVDADGNIYVAGAFSGTVDLDGNGVIDPVNEVSQGGLDMFAAKYSSSGNVLWARSWELNDADGVIGRGIALRSNTLIVVSNEGDIWKLDTDGNSLANHSGFFAPRDVAVDSNSNVYMTGFFSDTIHTSNTVSGQTISLTSAGLQDIVIAKFDSNGLVDWAQRAGGAENNDRGFAIATDDAGHVYVAGEFGGTADFGDDTLEATAPQKKGKKPSSSVYSDVFVSKLDDSDGSFVWTSQAGGLLSENAEAIAVNGVGDAYITGYFQSTTADFGADTIAKNDDSTWAGFVAKLDSAGKHLWARSFEGDENYSESGNAIATDGAGNVLIAGSGGSNVQLGQFSLPQNESHDGHFMAMLDADGNYEAAFQIVAEDSFAFPHGLVVGQGDNAYIAGRFRSDAATFATGETLASTPDSNGDLTSDTFLTKLEGGQPSIVSLSASPDPVAQGNDLLLLADGVFDIGGSVQSVAFYRDSDGDGLLNTAVDQLLATDTDISDAWAANVSTAGFALGTHTVFAQATDNDGLTSDVVTATVEVVDAPIGTEIYIADIRFDSRRGGKDWRAVVEIRDVDGNAVEGVTLKVHFNDNTYTIETDSNGIARTAWQKNLDDGNYYANAYDLALAGYFWDPFSSLNEEDDSDGDGKLDDLLTV